MTDLAFKPTCFECECGNEKSRSARACDRCLYLDGENWKQSLVIAALRGTDGLTINELCIAVDGAFTLSARTAMSRTLQRLERKGRLRRYWRDSDKHAIRAREGLIGRITHGGTGCWVYALDGRAA